MCLMAFIIQTTVFVRILIMHSWASEGFFPGGATRVFFLNFSRGGKSGEICMRGFPASPSDAHECILFVDLADNSKTDISDFGWR